MFIRWRAASFRGSAPDFGTFIKGFSESAGNLLGFFNPFGGRSVVELFVFVIGIPCDFGGALRFLLRILLVKSFALDIRESS